MAFPSGGEECVALSHPGMELGGFRGSVSREGRPAGSTPLSLPVQEPVPSRERRSRCRAGEGRTGPPGVVRPGRALPARLPRGEGPAAPPGGPVLAAVPPPGAVVAAIGRGTCHSGSRAWASGGGRKRRPRRAGWRERPWARPRPSIRATSPNGPSLPPPPPPLGRIVPRPPCM